MTPSVFESLDISLHSDRIRELMLLNQDLQGGGMMLSRTEADEILTERSRALKSRGRIELDIGVTKTLLKRLAVSPFVGRDQLVKTVSALYEVFHHIKNQTSDHVGDDEVIDAIMIYFEKVCGGSAELLTGKGTERIIENYRDGQPLSDIPQNTEEESYWHFDE
ncbi:MAG TPA: DUF6323 family protein [Clostridia bacterium]|nr:DUF6323 family protein [Clostridia bacterium]